MGLSVVIYCDEESHAPKVAFVDRLTYGGTVLQEGRQSARFDEGSTVPIPNVELWGTVRIAPKHSVFGTRERRAWECPLCGLRVVARRERVEPIAQRLIEAGVSRISLAALGAIV